MDHMSPTYTHKEIAEKMNRVDGLGPEHDGVIFNQIRNLEAKRAFRPLSVEKRGPRISSRSAILYDNEGLARVRMMTKLADIGLAARELGMINDSLQSEAVEGAIKSGGYLHVVYARDANGYMDWATEISSKREYGGEVPKGTVIHGTLRLNLTELFKGLF
jgi:hypothetical protein